MSPLTRSAATLLCLGACARPSPPAASDGFGDPPPPQGPPPGSAMSAPTPAPTGPTVPAVAPASPNAMSPHAERHQPTTAAFQRGKATYYADSLAGNPTASGEPYDPTGLTAAHRTLPFGSMVDVVRTDGRWVRVRITDRGPFARGRVIDLSRRAAKAIGMLQAGVVDVTLYVVSRPH